MTYTAPFLVPAFLNLGPTEMVVIALIMLLLFVALAGVTAVMAMRQQAKTVLRKSKMAATPAARWEWPC